MKHPLDWRTLFHRDAPLEVEIGFGNGERLLRHALAHPEINLVGVDLSWPAARRALRKVNLNQVDNVLLLQASAEAALTRLFAPNSLNAVEALFPCPWPGVRHQRRRLFNERFLTILNNRLNHSAVFHMVTDHENFFKWVNSQIPEHGFLKETGLRGPGLETKYERKWCGEGQDEFHELWLTKTKHLKTASMEDIVLDTIRLDHFNKDAVQNREFHEQDFIAFKELVFDQEKAKGLLHVVVSEDDFLQAFWLEFRQVEEGWRLRPALGCGLVPTGGVRRAVQLAAELAQI